jgi:hypothetical protein
MTTDTTALAANPASHSVLRLSQRAHVGKVDADLELLPSLAGRPAARSDSLMGLQLW